MACPARKIVDPVPFSRRVGPGRNCRRALWGKLAVYPLLLILTGLAASIPAAGLKTGILAESLPSRYRTQARFTAALERPISASWKGVTLRSLLRRLSREREVSILLDRRVDPEQTIDIDTGERSLRSAVDEIARLGRLGVSVVGNCLVLAPSAAAVRIRTLVAIRESERTAESAEFSDRPARATRERATIRWDDLDAPADIVRTIGRHFGLAIAGIEQVPHDLWAGAVLPDATAAEALSLVLNQFDLTFEWTNRGSGVRLIAIPASVAIERSYALHGKLAGETLHTLRSKIEGLDADVRGGRLVVRGTIEQHESVASILGLTKGPKRAAGKRPATPLERQSFTLQAHGVSLPELFDELQKQGLAIEYNADDLKKAGINLEQKVSLDLPRLPAQQFFTRLLDPYGLTFQFDHSVVVIRPK